MSPYLAKSFELSSKLFKDYAVSENQKPLNWNIAILSATKKSLNYNNAAPQTIEM